MLKYVKGVHLSAIWKNTSLSVVMLAKKSGQIATIIMYYELGQKYRLQYCIMLFWWGLLWYIIGSNHTKNEQRLYFLTP